MTESQLMFTCDELLIQMLLITTAECSDSCSTGGETLLLIFHLRLLLLLLCSSH